LQRFFIYYDKKYENKGVDFLIVNIAFIVLIAFIVSYLFEKIKLPGLLGMVLTGVFLGPYMKNIVFIKFNLKYSNYFLDNIFLSKQLIEISSELRNAALIVILIRAGLGINRNILNKIGIAAFKMSFIPGIFEGVFIIPFAMYILKFSFFEAGTLAFIIAAVSPAVVVPQMLGLKEKGYGENKQIPTLILAGASVDDVFAITIFGAFLNMAIGNKQNIIKTILNIPLSIILGIFGGVFIGLIFVWFFKKVRGVRDTKKVFIFMMIAILFHEIEKFIPIASLIGIMSIGFIILEKYDVLAKRLAAKFNKMWIIAEIILFVLIGAAVNINEIFNSGLVGMVIIIIGLTGRSIGVFISLYKTDLNIKEKLFCVVSYIPKATVQAAIGAIPLSKGIGVGEVILAISVLSIVITAPIGAIGIRVLAPKCLEGQKV